MKQTIIGIRLLIATLFLCVLICLPKSTSAQKEYDKNFPKDLKKHTLIVEQIPREFLASKLSDRDSASIATESEKIDYIQDLYLVKEPRIHCILVPRVQVDSVAKSNSEKYRYVLKYTSVIKKIDNVKTPVLGFYFHDTQKKNKFKTIEVYNYNSKATLVLIYGLISKAYPSPYKPKYW